MRSKPGIGRTVWVVLIILLVVVMAFLVRRGVRIPFLWKRRKLKVGGAEAPAVSNAFPLISPHLEPATEMFTMLQREKMESKKHRANDSGDTIKTVATVYRRVEDLTRTDMVALHYTERFLVTANPGSGMMSIAELWARPAERKIVQRAQAGNTPLERAVTLQRRLRDRTHPVIDTHVALALYVFRRYCKRQHKDPCDVSVLDTGPGWGSQAIAACAANLGEYNALLLVSRSNNNQLTEALQNLLESHRPMGSLGGNYWIRTVDFMQHASDRQYDIIIVSPRDLVPLYETERLTTCLKRGGWVILFLPPGDEYAKVGQLALDITQKWDPPEAYRLVRPGELHHALIWRKESGGHDPLKLKQTQ